MHFKCVQDFVLMYCTGSNRLFQFSANIAAIMSGCRFNWEQNGKIDWGLSKSSWRGFDAWNRFRRTP